MKRILKIEGTLLDKKQLNTYLEKISIKHSVIKNSELDTYPIPILEKNKKEIYDAYKILNDNLKLGIDIHPAGEWILDNYYIIEKCINQVKENLNMREYRKLPGIAGGQFKGFARIYVLASEIVAYTEGRINEEDLEQYMVNYQKHNKLTMEEIWEISKFINIAIIENIAEVCRKIHVLEEEKYKANEIVKRILENRNIGQQRCRRYKINLIEKEIFEESKYSFVEYISYSLKKYGKRGHAFEDALEEIVKIKGITVEEIIKKEHMDIALQKVKISNNIMSLKNIQQIDFLNIFQNTNGVEEILKKDPSKIYEKMDNRTKEYYRTKVKEIAKKTNTSEIYISKEVLELAKDNFEENQKKGHIGYYLIDEGVDELYKKINYKTKNILTEKRKEKIFYGLIIILTVLISIILVYFTSKEIGNNEGNLWLIMLAIIPVSEIVIQTIQYISNKKVKKRIIPKMDYINCIPEDAKTMVVMPIILDSKEKVEKYMKNLEVYYLANKSENIYFTLLGDCTTSNKEIEESDKEIVLTGRKCIEKLNQKYGKIFNFIYRKRIYNRQEDAFLGWERKRGILTQFNEYILGNIKNPFMENTLENGKIEDIKYIITLDADTRLILNSAFSLIGSMAHILNKPEIDKNNNVVKRGYGVIQPRTSVSLKACYSNLFSRIFANNGGVDAYSNAISDIYQDNFGEGIYTGKGIYDVKVFSKVLKGEIPENTVLSHDLLEGSYLRCGLASDIILLDGYPDRYNVYINRISRWIRGDWQITKWIWNKKINSLSKYKIIDNLRRSLFEIFIMINILIYLILGSFKHLNVNFQIYFFIVSLIFPYILEMLEYIIFRKNGQKKYKTFANKINGIKGSIVKSILRLACLPHKAYISLKAITKANYRKIVSKKHLLEWMTSEEAEIQEKCTFISYVKQMWLNILIGILGILLILKTRVRWDFLTIFILWIIAPFIMYKISEKSEEKYAREKVNKEDIKYINNIGRKTWKYFEDFLNEENNYLIPDNYQEDRKNKIVNRTSSTNIGLSLVAVISAYDIGYINLKKAIELIRKIIYTVETLPKWNGHLYNWYNIKDKNPLIPRFISTVDSGNFVGYLYITRKFLEENNKENNLENIIKVVEDIIKNTNFSVLYDDKKQLFSIGFNIEENKLIDSYYDLLASEARQASLVAIAKRDIPVQNWYKLGRTLTSLGKYRGLLSWSGTAFEYLMPNINIPTYKGSLLEESSKFAIYCQKAYAKKVNLPFGISEAAFNLKDLKGNYQYKACGIPWIGLKRGLEEDFVIASYAGMLALNEIPKEEIENIKQLGKQGIINKYGMYESIDYTPERQEEGKKATIVKTYMAHHQGLILLSINNFLNNNILQKRFMENPEIKSIDALLEEGINNISIVTKEKKEKVKKIKYKDYRNYLIREYSEYDKNIPVGNIIGNDIYTNIVDYSGRGVSRYKEIYINRFKRTDDYSQGIFVAFKNVGNKKVWTTDFIKNNLAETKYKSKFTPDSSMYEIINGDIKTEIKTIISASDNVEIKRIKVENLGEKDETIEVSVYFEPVLSKKEDDYSHQSFNNLFLKAKWNASEKVLIYERKSREDQKKMLLATTISTNSPKIGDIEYEIDQTKFIGRGNLEIPHMVKDSIPFSNKIGLVTEPIVALRRTVIVKSKQNEILDFILSVGEEEKNIIEDLAKYKNMTNVTKEMELTKAKVEAENRYFKMNADDIETYQKIATYITFENPINKLIKTDNRYTQNQLWKYGISGDFPIILINIKNMNGIKLIGEVLKLYKYFKNKNLKIEVVIVIEEKNNFNIEIEEEINNQISNRGMMYLKGKKEGIFLLRRDGIDERDFKLLEIVSEINILSGGQNLKNTIEEIEAEILKKVNYHNIDKNKCEKQIEEKEDIDILKNSEELLYYNEYGAFSKNGREYFIRVNKENRTPTVWSHIMANENFGTVVTESMGGYSWYKNSRLNRISSWENNTTYDIPSEILYIKDIETESIWSLGLNPKPDSKNYNVIYGFGYAKYIHLSDGIEQELKVFVPKNDSCKINLLKLKNKNNESKRLRICYYIKPTLGEDILDNKYISIDIEENRNILFGKKVYCKNEIDNYMYISSSERIINTIVSKRGFCGKNGINNPILVEEDENNINIGQKCMAIEIEVDLEAYQEKEIVFILGAEEGKEQCIEIRNKYSNIKNVNKEFLIINNGWKKILERLQVKTSIKSFDILLNGWIPYQIIESRIIGRSGYYQSGGAYGFRDQLQDAIGLRYIEPKLLKNQIIRHSKHQFKEGDVEHWWHEEIKSGIRTRISDDLLWLVFAVIEYIEVIGKDDILDIETTFIYGEILNEKEEERYEKHENSLERGSIFEHCLRAIEKSLNFGKNGLPKIGTGDWNDGMNKVGNKGIGESVWLGFFLYYILDKFIPIIKRKNLSELVNKYERIKEELRKNLNKNAWDGRWYKRAFGDEGYELGSIKNEECKIDSISQSWSVISNAGENDKKFIAMDNLEKYLIDRENGIIKLLNPPFENSEINPGYIKAYLPGIRENGGQYTHAAIWAIIAEAILGFNEKALELFNMINPIEHSKSKELAKKYKVEPYVMCADVYGEQNLQGKGGWTWYTGSASWYYKAGIEYILGIKIKDGYMEIKPNLDKRLGKVKIEYKWKKTIYNIVINSENAKGNLEEIIINGKRQKNKIRLDGEDKIYNIEVLI